MKLDRGHGLARVLSKLGFASRSEAADLIKAGRVKVTGRVVKDPERRTFIGKEKIEVDGRSVEAGEKIYLAMNKPLGVLTTYSDPQGRPTVYDFLPSMSSWVFPVGRLDAKTTGLLLFTNDTEWGEILTHSSYGIPKTYEVKLRGELDDRGVERLRGGVELDDGHKTLPCQCEVFKRSKGSTWLKMVIKEGKNRQIRRMAESLGFEVVKLRRVAVGDVTLGGLKPGQTRSLTRQEVDTYFVCKI